MRAPDDVDRQILRIAVPAFAALVTEPLMVLTDTAVVGRLGTTSLAGLAAAGAVLGTVVGLCVFLAYGTTAVVARNAGGGRPDRAAAAAVGGVWLAAGLGVLLGAGIAISAGPVGRALASSPASADAAREYLVVSSLGLPSMLVMLATTGALRGLMDLRTPVVVAVVSNLLNAALSVFLVHGVGWGLAGAAAGTVVAQTVGAVWLVVVVAGHARRHGAGLAPRAADVLDAALRGVPLLVRTGALRAALLIAVAVAATFGDAPLAAHQIAVGLVTLLAFALDALAIAGQTLTGRSLGAGDVVGTRALTRRMMAWGAGFGGAAGLLLLASAPFVARLFTTDPAVLDAAVPAIVAIAVIQPLSGVVFVLDGVLIGAGDGAYLAWAGLLTLAVYAPLAVGVGWAGGGLTWLWVAYGGFILARLLTLVVRERDGRWAVTGA
ncbi:MATE family efflux transporter [Aeromicrobium marinum]|nr:MATE family efflux transporter [Aeromicrobium marinum]